MRNAQPITLAAIAGRDAMLATVVRRLGCSRCSEGQSWEWSAEMVTTASSIRRARLLSLNFACVHQAAWPKLRQDVWQTAIGDSEAALAPTEHPGLANHVFIHIPSAVHDNPPGQRITVGLIQPV